MKILDTLKGRFEQALDGLIDNPAAYSARIAQARDPRFGDYQANIAMPLAKTLGKNPVDIANSIVQRLQIDDLCESVDVAGPGFINLKLRSQFLASSLSQAAGNDRLGVSAVRNPQTYVVDYSAPNVAKPMHVGHIRSTVIGDSLCKILRFLGHRVISDNHLGDWGTQFGMVIYGYKHFVDRSAYERAPVAELSRLYRLVQQIIGYQAAVSQIDKTREQLRLAIRRMQELIAKADAGDKKAAKEVKAADRNVAAVRESLEEIERKIANIEGDSSLHAAAHGHPVLDQRAQLETAKLHSGDPENLALWNQFLPWCIEEIETVYRRLGIKFDLQLGESFYHPMLGDLVQRLLSSGLAQQSEGATCIFLEGYDAPMIIRKQDGAFLYATSDLATIEYRLKQYSPDVILYVVDHRQSEHFAKLFAAAAALGYHHVTLKHVSFGTVLGPDGKPFKTRSGTVIGLEYLLDEAVQRAYQVVCHPERLQKANLRMTNEEQHAVAEAVGLGAIKYADLCHNRTSDYEFDIEQMVQLDGNTSAYIQYSFARASSILRNSGVDLGSPNVDSLSMELVNTAERDLALYLLQFEDVLHQCLEDYLPSVLVAYLYGIAKQYAVFFDQCPVLKADNEHLMLSRLRICDATCKTLQKGLELLGIATVPRM